MDELKKNPLWWKGPPWLQEDQTTWPPVPDGYRTRPLPGEAVIVYPVIKRGEQREVIETTRFSNLRKLIGTTQQVLQFIRMCAKRSGVKLTTLGSEDHTERRERGSGETGGSTDPSEAGGEDSSSRQRHDGQSEHPGGGWNLPRRWKDEEPVWPEKERVRPYFRMLDRMG